MAEIESMSGAVEKITRYGVVIGGKELKYSHSFEGQKFDESHVGKVVSVSVDHHPKGDYIVDPDFPKNGSNRTASARERMGPVEIALKKSDGVRIARSVAIDRAIQMREAGVSLDDIKQDALAIKDFLLKGHFERPQEKAKKPPPEKAGEPETTKPESEKPAEKGKDAKSPSLSKRVANKKVNALWQEAKKNGLPWKQFLRLSKDKFGKSPYFLDRAAFNDFAVLVKRKVGKVA